MKHLIRYNESAKSLDIEYIESCFSEVIDEHIDDYENRYYDDWLDKPIKNGLYHVVKFGDIYTSPEKWNIRILVGSDNGQKTSGVHKVSYRIGYDLDELAKESNKKSEILNEIGVAVKRINGKYSDYIITFDKQFVHGEDSQSIPDEYLVVNITI
jgi:hypothetical protein